ncbi:MAG: LCCL domain-containing protein, partial [Methylococcales bacterium]|nr:LCCL domain-containing protein [Methylococcales bacterium]
DCSGTGSCIVAMLASKNVTAIFKLSTCPVSYSNIVVTGMISDGTVWGSNPYIDDSDITMAAVHAGLISVGQTATIKMTPTGYSYNFLGSTRNGVTTHSYTSGGCGVTLSVISTPTYILTVTTAGAGSGTVTPSTKTLTWVGSTGTASYTSGTIVTLTASFSAGSTFTGWSGACSGTGSCTVSMTQTRDVTAIFNLSTP